MEDMIALKDLRLNMEKYTKKIQDGHSFIVLKRNKPIFKISPVDSDSRWEELIDFTKMKKGGVDIDSLISAL